MMTVSTIPRSRNSTSTVNQTGRRLASPRFGSVRTMKVVAISSLSAIGSSLGTWLDPMADKLLIATTFIVLTLPNLGLANRLPVWFTVLVLFRDLGIVLTVIIANLAIGRLTFKPTLLGKAATATYIVTAVAAMLFNYLGYHSPVVDLGVYTSLGITI